MTTLAVDILDTLEAAGLIGGVTGWARAAEYLPPSPDKVVAVFETPGLPPEVVSEGSTETAYDIPGFQVRARGDVHGFAAMRDKLAAIYIELHGTAIAAQTDRPGYLFVRAVQSAPMSLGLDEKSRPGATWNFVAIKER